MARTVTPKVNGHVTYYTVACKPLPATVIAVVNASTVNLRITRTGQVFNNVPRQITNKAPQTWKVA